MSLRILYGDELRGFYKSRVMLFLWIGLPLLTVLLHLLQPRMQQQEMSLTMLSSFVVSSISGTLTSVMLAIGIVHEKSRGVYPLFLVRPVKRSNLLLAKFFAVFSCVAVASLITIAAGLAYDYAKRGGIDRNVLAEAWRSAVMSFSMMAMSSASGVLIGVLSPSVLVAVILVLYGGNQFSSLILIPVMLRLPNPQLIAVGAGLVFTVLLLWLAVFLFKRKQF